MDRFNRKWIMSMATLLQMFALGCTVFLLFADRIDIWHLYVFVFVLSSAGYTFGNSQHSVIPQLVSKQQLTSANAKLTFVDTFISMIGPGVAGFLIALYSFEVSFSIYLICLAMLFLMILFIQVPNVDRKKENQSTSIWQDMKEGIHSLLENKTLLTPTMIVLFSNLASSLVTGVLIFYAVDVLGSSEKEVGLMFSIGAIGGLIGALTVSQIRKHFGRGKIFVFFKLVDVLSMIILVFAHTWWFIGLFLMIRTFSVTVSNIVYFTIRQEFTPNHLLGRVAGTSSMMMKLALPAGLFLSGIWAEYLAVQTLFMMAALIYLILFLVARKNSFIHLQ